MTIARKVSESIVISSYEQNKKCACCFSQLTAMIHGCTLYNKAINDVRMCNSFSVFVARFTQTALVHCFKNEENQCSCKIEENQCTQTAVATYAEKPQNDLVMIKIPVKAQPVYQISTW